MSPQARENRLAKQISNRKNESPEAREKRLAKQRSNRQNESLVCESMCVENIFFKAKKLQKKIVIGAITNCFEEM